MDIEDARQPAVVIFRPHVDLVSHANQLGRDANAVNFAPNATLEHIVHTQFLANLRHRLIGLLVRHRRRTRNHSHAMRRHLSQSHDCLFAQTIAEVLLRWVSAQVFEGQNGEHDARPLRFYFRCLDYR